MKPIPILLLLLILAMAVHAQESTVTIAFDGQKEPPTVTLVGGEGSLYHYSKQPGEYRGVYYLFTDAPVVKIAPKSKLAKGFSLAFNMHDTKSEWLSNDTVVLGNDVLVSQKMLDDAPISFRWEERASVHSGSFR